jgi:hypothetical protein
MPKTSFVIACFEGHGMQKTEHHLNWLALPQCRQRMSNYCEVFHLHESSNREGQDLTLPHPHFVSCPKHLGAGCPHMKNPAANHGGQHFLLFDCKDQTEN